MSPHEVIAELAGLHGLANAARKDEHDLVVLEQFFGVLARAVDGADLEQVRGDIAADQTATIPSPIIISRPSRARITWLATLPQSHPR